MTNPLRILAMDGGGALAGTHAVALGRLYGDDTPGREILSQFALVAGNSGGSIVMTALCCNYTPGEIAAFYADPETVRRMYSPRWSAVFRSIGPLRLLFPPYSSGGKRAALAALFDAKPYAGPRPSSIRMSAWPDVLHAPIDLLVTAYDYDRDRVTFFRSNPQSRAAAPGPHPDPTLADAVHASTNAPIIAYDRPAEVDGLRYWDGALAGYNNPVLAATVEALANHPDCVDNLRVLSLGTGAFARAPSTDGAPPPVGTGRAGTGLLTTLTKAAGTILADPPESATFHAYAMLCRHGLDGASRLVRLCPFVRPQWDAFASQWRLPIGLTAGEFSALVDMPSDAMAADQLRLLRTMVDRWLAGVVPNQPVRMGEHMACDIGDDTFAAGAARWRSLACEVDRDRDPREGHPLG